MNILLISQCTKNAREQSCRILDQFAERKGDGAWQTAITQEGLNTLRKLLRKTARRNTAVACHWIKKSGQTELLWIVGNLRRFNAQGNVPTHTTSRDILRSQHESRWYCTEAIALLAGIAGLFHDFGKAGDLFQQGLKGEGRRRYQPFRHEWISVRLFQAFTMNQTDEQWLTQLGTLNGDAEAEWLKRLQKDNQSWSDSPFKNLPPMAQVVAWLILSHHRLPQYLGKDEPDIADSERWLLHQLNVWWNALNHQSDWRAEELAQVWTFPQGTPLRSRSWQKKAQQLAKRALHAVSLAEYAQFDQTFTLHLARLSLMLADHHYSAQMPVTKWQDPEYGAWANTDRQTGERKQKLDEHNVGVSHHAFLLARSFSGLRQHLPAIARHKGFRERAKDPRYHWQNKAWDVAVSLREHASQHGFFGINMASTGCGKTFANARIMYALANEEQGCRFSVALGLRTLTLQTGEALRTRLGLGEDDLAVLVGSPAVKELQQQDNVPDTDTGSASEEALFESHQYVHYEGTINNGPLRQWLEKGSKLSQLVNAPVLVATIDHLMPATEGVRGGKQIAPMLRLLTSDLVLDEPDDFDVDDDHPLCRLVNWAGMLGCRVLLSSATLPPELVLALHTAYCTGRKAYQQACGEQGLPLAVSCAWFDEDDAQHEICRSAKAFYESHCRFAESRVKRLAAKPVLRQAELLNVSPSSQRPMDIVTTLAAIVHREMLQLHDRHHQVEGESDKTVSLGLVRMANIKPLVATALALMNLPSPEGYCIHYCVYHSQHPLVIRSHMEQRLDAAFSRHDTEQLWLQSDIGKALKENPQQHHLFVVLATSVVEVGRDWDADWGIIEPSSMRSLIQFAGRIQRHRKLSPQTANILILAKNFNALRSLNNERPAYCRPGFESKDFMLSDHHLSKLGVLPESEQYLVINAKPRILSPKIKRSHEGRFDDFNILEHARLSAELLDKSGQRLVAADWWRAPVNWSGELQRRKPFRLSQPERQYFLYMAEDDDKPVFMARDDASAGWEPKAAGQFTSQPLKLKMAEGVSAWMQLDYAEVLLGAAEAREMELAKVSERYGEINLPSRGQEDFEPWYWHPLLGVFRALE